MISRLIYTLLIITTAHVKGVSWYTATSPVVFGDSIELICNHTSGSYSCKRCTQRWYGGPELKLIAFDGITSDEKKYTSVIEKGHFNLIIQNFSTQDVLFPYVCTYGFVSHTKNLTLEDDFEFLPTNETMFTSYNFDEKSRVQLNVDFKEVFPIPNCSIFINGDDYSATLEQNVQKLKFFYQVSFRFSHNMTETSCNGKLHMDCKVGSKQIGVLHDSIDNMCKREMKNMTYVCYLVGGICLVVFVFVFIIIIRYTCVKSKRNVEKRGFWCYRHGKEFSISKSHNRTCKVFDPDGVAHDESVDALTERTRNQDNAEVKTSYQDISTNNDNTTVTFHLIKESTRQSTVKCQSDNSLYLCRKVQTQSSIIDNCKMARSTL